MKKLVITLVTMLLPIMASAYDAQIDGIYYNFDQTAQTAEVTGNGYICYGGEVTIPSKVTYNDVTYSVTSIGDAFCSCSGLTSVTIPESVTSIGKRAFSRCSGLTSVTIPESVTSIGDEAFYNCSGLTSVTIPNRVTTIGYSVFCGCSGLTSITIPKSLTSIGSYAFYGCDKLDKMIISDIAAWCSVEKGAWSLPEGHHLYSDEETEITALIIPEGVKYIASETFVGCYWITSVSIPNSVTSIGHDAFNKCKGLASVKIPNSVTSIGGNAFLDCSSLTTVSIGSNVTSIDYAAFYNCPKLTEVYCFAEDVPSTNSNAFNGSNTENATLYVPVISMDSYKSTEPWSNFKAIAATTAEIEIGGLWYEFVLETKEAKIIQYKDNYYSADIVIPDAVEFEGVKYSVTGIKDKAFYGCSGLTSITIPKSLTSIGSYAFYGCDKLDKMIISDIAAWCSVEKGAWSLPEGHHLYSDEETEITALIIPEGVIDIASETFVGCYWITSVNIPNSVTNIGHDAFNKCKGLASVKIPNSVTSIGGNAFLDCSSLTSVSIGSNVTSIDYAAFYNCPKLTEVYCYAEKAPSTYYNAFNGSNTENATLFVPMFSIDSYKSTEPWNKFKTIEGVDIVKDEELEEVIEEILNDVMALLEDPSYRLIQIEEKMVKDKVYVPEHNIMLEFILEKFHEIINANTSYEDKKVYEEFYDKLKGKYLTKEQIKKIITNEFELPYNWDTVSPLYNLPDYLQTGAFTCNDGGCIKIGNEIEVRNETKSLTSFHSKVSENKNNIIYFNEIFIPFTITIEPDEGYRIKSLKIGDRDTTATSFGSDFAGETFIVEFEPTGDAKKVEKPTITFENGKLKFACATEDVTYKYTISGPNAIGEGNDISLSPNITITVVATRSGYEDSAPAELQLPYSIGKLGDLNADGVVNAADAVKLVDIIMGKE